MKWFKEDPLGGILALGVLVICALLVRKEFMVGPTVITRTEASKFEQNWTELTSSGRAIGNDSASITIVEFTDFECPFCSRFHESLKAIRRLHPQDVRIVFVHTPGPTHRFAVPAIRAAECAARFGRFEQFADLLFEQQDSLGLKSFGTFAAEAGIRDTVAISQCAKSSAEPPYLTAGRNAAQRFAIAGTPTVIINGWRFGTPPSLETLNGAIAAIRDGRDPKQGLDPRQ